MHRATVKTVGSVSIGDEMTETLQVSWLRRDLEVRSKSEQDEKVSERFGKDLDDP
jgi:hypothetical protein